MNYVDNFMFVHQSYNEKENLDGLTYWKAVLMIQSIGKLIK